MKTIHLIFNAHLDPVWLWPWHAGVTEALATARNACDMLDECADLIFTRGESWFYEQVERHDPATFERIRKHIASGRWEIVGGWYLQPDCNQPGKLGFQKQFELGKRYFQKTFGQWPDTGYNVDSFGHNAALPGLMHEAGQKHYIMMRPQEQEMTLPARLFTWRGYEGGPSVTTFRIAAAYTTLVGITEEHVRACLTQLPEGIDHTMCFMGLGDHGGGPSREMVQWCRDRVDAFEGARLVFSSPSRFFKAIAGQEARLPVVTGELQQHAVGCYGIARQLKTQLRQAERQLEQVERALPEQAGEGLEGAWKKVCFHHFHDTLGGTCIPSAYGFVKAEVGGVVAMTEDLLRRKVIDIAQALPADKRQRIVMWNPGPHAFRGFVEHEPWLEWTGWSANRRLEDAAGRAIPYQVMASEALVGGIPRLVIPCELPAGGVMVAAFDPWQDEKVKPAEIKPDAAASGKTIRNARETVAAFEPGGEWRIGGTAVRPPELALIADETDTWSHGIDRYKDEVAAKAVIKETRMVDAGPLMASAIQYGTIGESKFDAEWRVYAGEAAIHLRLHVEWVERQKILKLVWNLPEACVHREDGIVGGVLKRAADGRELPLRDLTRLHLASDQTLGVACPDTFALDGDAKRVRLTLLRSPVMAHHVPSPAEADRRRFSDRGEQVFEFVFAAGASVAELEAFAAGYWMLPLATDLTRGMPKRVMRNGW